MLNREPDARQEPAPKPKLPPLPLPPQPSDARAELYRQRFGLP